MTEPVSVDEDAVDLAEDPQEGDVSPALRDRYREAVVFSTDWTAGTVVNQLKSENIRLSPRFQRRDAWDKSRKSRLIESLILGLPVPPVVLAEVHGAKGKYLVLDGKQRLLSLLQFWGLGQGEKNAFALASLEFRQDLRGKTWNDLCDDAALADDRAALENQTIRTVVIRNWPDNDFLHTVFLRLNTGSLKLSPQELRQALLPGPFADFVDDKASESSGLRRLLHLSEPDSRMRDVEILARFVAYRARADEYPGRLKTFLDDTFGYMNSNWSTEQHRVLALVDEFEKAMQSLFVVFGVDRVARKERSRQLNRTLLDAQLYYFADPSIRAAAEQRPDMVVDVQDRLLEDRDFLATLERDTAGFESTELRFARLAKALSEACGSRVVPPSIPRRSQG